MPPCVICGEALPDGARSCSVCGSGQPESPTVPMASVVAPPPRQPTPQRTGLLPPGSRVCTSCGQVFGAEFTDAFCTCGVELIEAAQAVPDADVQTPHSPTKPAAGTPCLALIGPDKSPLRYFALTKDAVLIGRLDAVAGSFPEIDVTEWLDSSMARKVSRRHALVLRSRQTGAFSLRPLAGNTGTQIEADMVAPLADYPLSPGTRLILGGAVRLKFEIA